MKTHDNCVFVQILWYFFVYNIIQTSCFFFLEKVADLYEQSNQGLLSAVGAYWNPWLYVSAKLPTFPSPKPTFRLKWEASVNVNLGEG